MRRLCSASRSDGEQGRWLKRAVSDTSDEWPIFHVRRDKAAFPICAAQDLKAVIHCLKPQHPTLRLFQRCRW
jgi:hypothetical protein